MNNIDWYALIDSLLGQLKIEYELEVTDHHLAIKTAPENYQILRAQMENALSDVSSVLPYSVEVAPLQETVPEALSHFKGLLGQERFADIALNPDELFNEQKGSEIIDGILYSKPTTNKRTISVWTDALNALVADLSNHSREALKALWANKESISRDSLADSQEAINYQDIVKQNFGMRIDEHKAVRMFFNFRQLWQDLFVPELAIRSNVVSMPALSRSQSGNLVIHKAQLLDYLRQELHSNVLWRIFQTEEGPIATPLYLDTSQHVYKRTKVSIIIDRSGSMNSIFDVLTNNILTFIERLEPSAEVSILFFDDNIGPRKTFSAGDLKAITTFVKSLKPKGNTYLYKALNFEFNELLKSATQGDNTAVLLLTDGADGTPNASAAINDILNAQQQFEKQGVKVPKIFTIGIGDDHSIQKLDARLAGERLIINSLAEFDKVFKYIHEIQYPANVHSLVVAQKPDQLNAFKITTTLNGNVQSPDIYFTFHHSAIGVIGSNQKQIIRLKGKPLEANVHDMVKGALTKAREVIATKPSSTIQKELVILKESVAKLGKEKQTPYEKATLDDLVEFLDAQSIQQSKHVRKYVVQKASTPAFTMEYDATKLLPSTKHFTGNGQRLAPVEYNIAGKLLSPIQEPITQSSPPGRLTTRINAQQDQMTVHVLDNGQTEQKRLYADCVPLINEMNQTPFLHCHTDQFQGFVFPHDNYFQSPGDNYNLSSCRPITYYGKPSVACEGNHSSAVLTPNIPARPFEHLSENIALGAVLVYWCKQIYKALTTTTATITEPPKDYLTDKAVFKKKTKDMLSYLSRVKREILATQPFDGDTFHLSEIDDFQNAIESIQRQFSNGILEKSCLEALYNEIKTFKKEIVADCKCIVEQRRQTQNPITPQLTLERQRDWSLLITPKPVVDYSASNIPKMKR